MINIKEKFKPSVSKKILLVFAGTMWICVGIMLILMAIKWLHTYKGNSVIFSVIGIVFALIIHHFGFLKIVNKNLKRISELPDKPCIFSFISWKSYLIIIIMVTMGITLRHSSLHKQYLSVIYLGIGLALFLSSIKYFRNLLIDI